MPSLITYERKRLTDAQYHALGAYIVRKRLKEETIENGNTTNVDNDKQGSPSCNGTAEEAISNSSVKPTAREIREQKQQELKDIQAQLAELETMLAKLKDKKHELFEEFKSLVPCKKHEEKERQMQGFPSPFMHHPGISPGATMMNVPMYRPGMKPPKSPSPPLVQLYSNIHPVNPMPSNLQALFPPMTANRMQDPENMNQGYQFPQNYPPHQPIQGPRLNPPPNSPRPPSNSFPPHDRTFPPFGTPQMPTHQTPPRPSPPSNQPPFMPPKKRDSHAPNRSRHH